MKKTNDTGHPIKVLDVGEWTILRDTRQWIVRLGIKSYYFTSLEHALWNISEQIDRNSLKCELQTASREIKKAKEEFLKLLIESIKKIEHKI